MASLGQPTEQETWTSITLGEGERVLTATESARLLRAADQPFRSFLLAMRHTIARPQEVRLFRWKHLSREPAPMFVLRDFKAKRRRKEKTAVRIIALDDGMVRLLDRIAKRRGAAPDDFVFVNRHGKPWTANAIRCQMRRLRQKVGLAADENGEHVVAYTMRHTSATNACANGVRERVLAELMGHANPRTTQHYQHLQAHPLSEAIR
jgi:integrase